MDTFDHFWDWSTTAGDITKYVEKEEAFAL